jgi:hypothetical protein
MVLLFNLEQESGRKRHEADAFLVHCSRKFWFELKSTTTGSLSTVRDFGRAHIKKWADMHWIVGFFKKGEDRPAYCHYLTPDDMKKWTDRVWAYVELDYGIGDLAADRLTLDDVYHLLGKRNRYTLADARRVQKLQYGAVKYLELSDLPGGVSPHHLKTLRAPFVTDEWIEQELGQKDLYSESDLNKLITFQATPAAILEAIKPDIVITSENVSKVAPHEFLDEWTVLSNRSLSPGVAARKLLGVGSKSRRKRCFDVEPGYSPEAMLRIVRDRCRYLIDRGSTLNNPHIEPQFFAEFEKIVSEHAKVLRMKLNEYIEKAGLENVKGSEQVSGC